MAFQSSVFIVLWACICFPDLFSSCATRHVRCEFPDQGSNPCRCTRSPESQPLDDQARPAFSAILTRCFLPPLPSTSQRVCITGPCLHYSFVPRHGVYPFLWTFDYTKQLPSKLKTKSIPSLFVNFSHFCWFPELNFFTSASLFLSHRTCKHGAVPSSPAHASFNPRQTAPCATTLINSIVYLFFLWLLWFTMT